MKIICSIHDVKAEVWLQPMFFMANGQAIRTFEDAVNGDNEIAKHPEDYTLFAIGEFNEFTGDIAPYSAPQPLEKGINLLKGDSLT